MPLNPDLHKVMIIGSGPIVIGQAAEFDYAGSQACRALKDAGLEVVLVNPNPATIMTDHSSADHIYIEPLTLETLRRIILKEKPDSLLSTLGGQSGLTLSMQLAKEGFLEQHGVKLLGAKCETIEKAEDRQQFKDTMLSIHQPVIPSEVVETVEDALAFAKTIGYPVIVRPAYTLGGSGGGICQDEKELAEIAENGLRLSPITQILVEKCISGWKEIEFEVMRDKLGNVIAVCSMENIDPVGVHTGDSIVVAPALTLADKEYQMLRRAALDIITALEVEGGCNCQFALNPDTFDYAVIEVNPRVSRSSALASKATGYPIAKCAAQIAIGYTLDEMKNAVTGKTCAAFEPALDYIVAKIPKWPFDKFVYGKRTLGTQMKATGEVMSIADTFEMALMKAVRGAEISLDTLNMPKFANYEDSALWQILKDATDERLFAIYELMKRGVTTKEIHDFTMIDMWFLEKLNNLLAYEREIKDQPLTHAQYTRGKKLGYTDEALTRICGTKPTFRHEATFKMVDTCAGEFAATTPYFYGTYDTPEQGGENEAMEFIGKSGKETVMVFGSGPIRIGQGIEFDFCSVHCTWAFAKEGYETIIVNNNPETVSTDFDIADKLYFEPLTPEDVESIVDLEKPDGAVVQFGGQTAIKLTESLMKMGVPILGTSAENVDAAEDRELFDEILEQCEIPRPTGGTVFTAEEAKKVANRLGYPVLVRPSYVLGGQGMQIAINDHDIDEFIGIINRIAQDHPILVDKYLQGKEIEVDAVCDGEDILIPGIMEHIERAGIHSGDSISVYPAQSISQKTKETIAEYTRRLAKSLHVIGLINIQFIVCGEDVYVIEVNPRSSRTVPYISKVTGIPIVPLATKVIIGHKIKELGYTPGLQPEADYFAIKMPVFSFEKIRGADISLGPEMKSTGECLGIAKTFDEALYKAFIGAGVKLPKHKNMIMTVRDEDKEEAVEIGRRFEKIGYKIFATEGTAKVLTDAGVKAMTVNKIEQESPNLMDLILGHKIDLVIDTPPQGADHSRDGFVIRRNAIETGVNVLTAIDTAKALITSLENTDIQKLTLIDIAKIK